MARVILRRAMPTIAAGFPVSMGRLAAEETVGLSDARRGSSPKGDLEPAAKVVLLGALQRHAGDEGSPMAGDGERQDWAHDAGGAL